MRRFRIIAFALVLAGLAALAAYQQKK